MFCANCGKKIQENAAFCRHCGAKIQHPKINHSIPTEADPIASSKINAPKLAADASHLSESTRQNQCAVQPDYDTETSQRNLSISQSSKKPRSLIIIIGITAFVIGIAICGALMSRDRQRQKEELLAAQEQLTQAQQDVADAQKQAEQAQQQADEALKGIEAAQKAQEETDDAQQPTETTQRQTQQTSKQSVSSVRQQAEAELDQVESQSVQLEALLQNALDQASLNRYSGQLFTLWDDEINLLWSHLKNSMEESAFDALTDEQIDWIVQKEAAIDAAGNEFAGGSAEQMARSIKGYELTQARVYYLMDFLP